MTVFTVLRYVIAVYILSSRDRLSVRLHKPAAALYQTKRAERRITQTTPYNNPGTLVFWWQRSRINSDGVTPTGAPSRGEVGSNGRFSTNISLCGHQPYLWNGWSSKALSTYFAGECHNHKLLIVILIGQLLITPITAEICRPIQQLGE